MTFKVATFNIATLYFAKWQCWHTRTPKGGRL